MCEVGTDLESVLAEKMVLSELIVSWSFRAITLAALRVEESARRGFDQQAVRTGAVSGYIGIESL